MTIKLIDQGKNSAGIQYSECDDFGEGIVQASTTITPGMAVAQGTLAGDIIPDNASGLALGVALENQKLVLGTVTGLRDAFAAADRVRYGREPGFKFMALVKSGESLVKGDLLQTNAGKFVKYVAGGAVDTTQLAVARVVQEDATGTLGADAYVLAKWGVA